MSTESALQELGRIASEAAGEALGRLGSGTVETGTVHLPGAGESPFHGIPEPSVVTSVSFGEGGTGGTLFVFGLGAFHRLAAGMLGEEPSEGDPTELELSTAGEAANQMMSAAAAEIGTALDIELKIAAPETKVFATAEKATAAFERTPHAFFVPFTLDGEPCRLVQLVPNALAVRATQTLRNAGGDAPTTRAGRPLGQESLRDVGVRVSAELGRARLTLAQAVGLPPGAVVELDRAPEDPIELYVNGRRFARGKLLVVEDEWAVEIEAIGASEEGR